MKKEIRTANIAEYVQAICQKNEELKEYTNICDVVLLFRGQPDKDYSFERKISYNLIQR